LRVVEVRGNRDDRAIDLEVELALLLEMLLGTALQLAQDERGNLGRRELAVRDADANDSTRLAGDAEREQRRCASRPTKMVPFSPTDTTDGTSASPLSSRMTTGRPFST
jgi:hypothetical protein